MDFTFDLSQTPVIGRRFLVKADEKGPNGGSASSPRRSLSLSPADSASIAGWKRPWMSQVHSFCMMILHDYVTGIIKLLAFESNELTCVPRDRSRKYSHFHIKI
jgi:hypothetical protein